MNSETIRLILRRLLWLIKELRENPGSQMIDSELRFTEELIESI